MIHNTFDCIYFSRKHLSPLVASNSITNEVIPIERSNWKDPRLEDKDSNEIRIKFRVKMNVGISIKQQKQVVEGARGKILPSSFCPETNSSPAHCFFYFAFLGDMKVHFQKFFLAKSEYFSKSFQKYSIIVFAQHFFFSNHFRTTQTNLLLNGPLCVFAVCCFPFVFALYWYFQFHISFSHLYYFCFKY